METKYYTVVVHRDTAEVTETKPEKETLQYKSGKREKIFWGLMYVLVFAAVVFCCVATAYALRQL